MSKVFTSVGDKFAVFFISLTRTLVPIVVGWVAAAFVAAGIEPNQELLESMSALLSAVFAGVYYVGIRSFETYISPKFGWLLGVAKAPVTYSDEQ